jgi:hypothetical protein
VRLEREIIGKVGEGFFRGMWVCAARLKPCPDTNLAFMVFVLQPVKPCRAKICVAPTGLCELFLLRFPTLKRGAKNHCAYGALGTTKAVPCKTVASVVSSYSCDWPAEVVP